MNFQRRNSELTLVLILLSFFLASSIVEASRKPNTRKRRLPSNPKENFPNEYNPQSSTRSSENDGNLERFVSETCSEYLDTHKIIPVDFHSSFEHNSSSSASSSSSSVVLPSQLDISNSVSMSSMPEAKMDTIRNFLINILLIPTALVSMIEQYSEILSTLTPFKVITYSPAIGYNYPPFDYDTQSLYMYNIANEGLLTYPLILSRNIIKNLKSFKKPEEEVINDIISFKNVFKHYPKGENTKAMEVDDQSAFLKVCKRNFPDVRLLYFQNTSLAHHLLYRVIHGKQRNVQNHQAGGSHQKDFSLSFDIRKQSTEEHIEPISWNSLEQTLLYYRVCDDSEAKDKNENKRRKSKNKQLVFLEMASLRPFFEEASQRMHQSSSSEIEQDSETKSLISSAATLIISKHKLEPFFSLPVNPMLKLTHVNGQFVCTCDVNSSHVKLYEIKEADLESSKKTLYYLGKFPIDTKSRSDTKYYKLVLSESRYQAPGCHVRNGYLMQVAVEYYDYIKVYQVRPRIRDDSVSQALYPDYSQYYNPIPLDVSPDDQEIRPSSKRLLQSVYEYFTLYAFPIEQTIMSLHFRPEDDLLCILRLNDFDYKDHYKRVNIPYDLEMETMSSKPKTNDSKMTDDDDDKIAITEVDKSRATNPLNNLSSLNIAPSSSSSSSSSSFSNSFTSSPSLRSSSSFSSTTPVPSNLLDSLISDNLIGPIFLHPCLPILVISFRSSIENHQISIDGSTTKFKGKAYLDQHASSVIICTDSWYKLVSVRPVPSSFDIDLNISTLFEEKDPSESGLNQKCSKKRKRQKKN